MADPIKEARALISDIQKANVEPFEKARLLYVNKLEMKKIFDRKATWMFRNPDFGLSPLVSEMMQSPVVPQGTYRQFEAGPIVTRHMKRFTSEELMNLISPDTRYRISAKEHIAAEMLDSERRIWDTMEFIAHQAIVNGEVKYILNDALGRLNVNITFPIPKLDAGTTWATNTTDIPADMSSWIEKYRNRYGKKPTKIRMTQRIWDYIKVNQKVQAVFSSYMRVIGLKESAIPTGMWTPEFICKALDWPPIEIYDERCALKFTATNAESQGSSVVTELTEGTWGVKVGDLALCTYVQTNGYEEWAFEARVTAVADGVSVTLDTVPAAGITAGDAIVFRPTFFPNNRILLAGDDEFSSNKFILPPFGLEYSGSSISALNWYGPRMDIFQIGTEPGLMVGRRNWHEFGMLLGNPNSMLSCKVIV